MTRQQWDQLWWEEFLKFRRDEPTKDLTLLHKATTQYMNTRYGVRPAEEKEAGPPFWMKLGALAIGVPMGFLGSIWTKLNGYKTLFGAIITAVAYLVAGLPVILPVFGLEAVLVAKVAGIGLTVVGILHKVYKFLYKEEHP